TPRIGKPIEINALWYNALCTAVELRRALDRDADDYEQLAEQVRFSMQLFWSDELGYCYDVIDAAAGDARDSSLRPNQIIAVALGHCALSATQERAVVDVCCRALYTPYGVRSLAPGQPGYAGRYRGNSAERDSVYHQGTAWAWLVGPLATAHLRVYRDKRIARSFLEPLIGHLADFGTGTICEICDGDPPHTPRGCIAQAWSVAELLLAWRATA
ncbi:MAG: amylo-alpha-1,6-glucosidase, partial [Myxococcota bacterium]